MRPFLYPQKQFWDNPISTFLIKKIFYFEDYDVYEYGDDIRKYAAKGRVLVIVNHQSSADVNILFTVLQTKGVATRKVFNFFERV